MKFDGDYSLPLASAEINRCVQLRRLVVMRPLIGNKREVLSHSDPNKAIPTLQHRIINRDQSDQGKRNRYRENRRQ